MKDFLSEHVYWQSGVTKGSHLGPLFFIDDVDEALQIFEHISFLGYDDSSPI
jgi:hypothetical protein